MNSNDEEEAGSVNTDIEDAMNWIQTAKNRNCTNIVNFIKMRMVECKGDCIDVYTLAQVLTAYKKI
jgi:hypothetical protein